LGFTVLNNINNETIQNSLQSRAIGVKFVLGEENVIRSTFTNSEQARVNLINLLMTTKGERLYHPSFGSDLLRLIFNPVSDILKQRITDSINNPVANWLPYITIENIDIKSANEDPSIQYDVFIKIEWALGQFSGDPIVIFTNDANVVTE
jgi:phage baseplate assembly protein W